MSPWPRRAARISPTVARAWASTVAPAAGAAIAAARAPTTFTPETVTCDPLRSPITHAPSRKAAVWPLLLT